MGGGQENGEEDKKIIKIIAPPRVYLYLRNLSPKTYEHIILPSGTKKLIPKKQRETIAPGTKKLYPQKIGKQSPQEQRNFIPKNKGKQSPPKSIYQDSQKNIIAIIGYKAITLPQGQGGQRIKRTKINPLPQKKPGLVSLPGLSTPWTLQLIIASPGLTGPHPHRTSPSQDLQYPDR